LTTNRGPLNEKEEEKGEEGYLEKAKKQRLKWGRGPFSTAVRRLRRRPRGAVGAGGEEEEATREEKRRKANIDAASRCGRQLST